MSRILLAVGHESFEKYLKDSVKNHIFVGEISYREAVVSNCLATNPDILIVRETLPGALNILELVYEIRQKCYGTRIIFISKERKVGDPLLSELVSLGVFDILTTNPIKITDLIAVIEKPNSFADVSFYRQKLVIDENSNKQLFTSPKQIVKTVYVDKSSSGDKKENNELKGEINSPENSSEIKNNMNANDSLENIEPIRNKVDIDDFPDEELIEDNAPSKKLGLFGSSGKKRNQSPQPTKTKVISFLSSNKGVGSTQVSFNTAISLAKDYKTLYIEVGEKEFHIHSILYLFNIAKIDVYRGDNLKEAVITKEIMTKNLISKSDISKNYKLLPDKLNLMFLPVGNKIQSESLKDLLINLTLQYEYDYIVIDLGGNYKFKEIEFLLSNSSQIYVTTTQDINYISSAETIMKNLKNNLNGSINLIVNKFEKDVVLNNNKIEEFTGFKVTVNIPYLKEILNNNYLGVASVTKTKDKNFINSINNLVNKITNN